MYGIMTHDRTLVVCKPSYQQEYVLSPFDYHKLPVMMENSFQVDQLLQELMVYYNRYDLVVFEYTKEMEEFLIIRRLRGY